MNNVSLQSVGRRISVGASNCCLFDSIRLILPGSLVQMLIANCPRADRVSAWTMVEIGMGVSYGIGTRVFVQQRLSSPTPPPPTPFICPSSILFRAFGQLSLNPANHRLGWSVGNQTSRWLCASPTHTDLAECLPRHLQHEASM